MRKQIIAGLSIVLAACRGGSPTGPTPGPTTPPPPPPPPFQIETLITVYRSAESFAQWSRAATTEERLGRTLLGVEDLEPVVGSTNLNNEGGRIALQAAIDRVRDQFAEADYPTAFGETRANLERYFNDADGDGWSIDGRHGVGRDWPHDRDGNDPDGWTAQIVVIVTRLR